MHQNRAPLWLWRSDPIDPSHRARGKSDGWLDLHLAQCLQHVMVGPDGLGAFRHPIMLLGGGEGPVIQKIGGNPDMLWILDGHRRRGGIAEQMGVDRTAESYPGA